MCQSAACMKERASLTEEVVRLRKAIEACLVATREPPSPAALDRQIVSEAAARIGVDLSRFAPMRRDAASVDGRRRLYQALRNAGWSYPRIGRALGVSHSTVIMALRRRPEGLPSSPESDVNTALRCLARRNEDGSVATHEADLAARVLTNVQEWLERRSTRNQRRNQLSDDAVLEVRHIIGRAAIGVTQGPGSA